MGIQYLTFKYHCTTGVINVYSVPLVKEEWDSLYTKA
jgi:hypothetical protein